MKMCKFHPDREVYQRQVLCYDCYKETLRLWHRGIKKIKSLEELNQFTEAYPKKRQGGLRRKYPAWLTKEYCGEHTRVEIADALGCTTANVGLILNNRDWVSKRAGKLNILDENKHLFPLMTKEQVRRKFNVTTTTLWDWCKTREFDNFFTERETPVKAVVKKAKKDFALEGRLFYGGITCHCDVRPKGYY